MINASDPLSPPHLFLPTSSYSTLVSSPYVSPALSASLTSLPPLLIQSGALETLRDEHTLLALRAAKAGVEVTHEVFRESVHVFHSIQKETSAKAALSAVGEWARTRKPVQPLPALEQLQKVDEELRTAWTSRPASVREEKPASSPIIPPRFTYEKRFERLPPLQLRSSAVDEAKKAVEEAEGYKAGNELTAVYYARREGREERGVVGWVRGLVGL